MRIVIIEDEKPAAEKLLQALQDIAPGARVLAILNSLGTARQWLAVNPCPDLLFMDIELTDGSSLDLFQTSAITCPVIFTTAYDEYWQAAFEHNGIDYLLKPIRKEKLRQALDKYERMKTYFARHLEDLASYTSTGTSGGYRRRFLVKRGGAFRGIGMDDIAYFQSAHKLVCLVTREGEKYLLDHSLAELEKQLDPQAFHRLNRKYLASRTAIGRIRALPKSRLDVELQPSVNEEVIVSQENAGAFKAWMSR